MLQIVIRTNIAIAAGPINRSLEGKKDLKPGITAPPWNRKLAFDDPWPEKASCANRFDKCNPDCATDSAKCRVTDGPIVGSNSVG
jgi:hypothetical protein